MTESFDEMSAALEQFFGVSSEAAIFIISTADVRTVTLEIKTSYSSRRVILPWSPLIGSMKYYCSSLNFFSWWRFVFLYKFELPHFVPILFHWTHLWQLFFRRSFYHTVYVVIHISIVSHSGLPMTICSSLCKSFLASCWHRSYVDDGKHWWNVCHLIWDIFLQ